MPEHAVDVARQLLVPLGATGDAASAAPADAIPGNAALVLPVAANALIAVQFLATGRSDGAGFPGHRPSGFLFPDVALCSGKPRQPLQGKRVALRDGPRSND